MNGGSVSFEYEWEPDIEDAEAIILDVSANITNYDPGCMYQRNGDPGYPPEGGEVENLEVTFPDGTKMDPIPDGLYQKLEARVTDEFNDHGGC